MRFLPALSWPRIAAATTLSILLIAILFATAPLLEYRRVESPDGAYVAIARTQPYQIFVPRMPGGGGDKPSRVTVYKGGQSCGSAWIAMASMIHDLRWDLQTRPRGVGVVATANWDLDACTVQVF